MEQANLVSMAEETAGSQGGRFSRVLLHIGYHKTGSTYLQDHLFQPENGFLADIGENRTRIVRDFAAPDNFMFDARHSHAAYEPYIRAAEERKLRFVLSHERLSGYPPSGGYDRMLIAQRLADTFPGSKILIVVREQLSLIRSIYSQYISDGGDLSLSRFLESPEPQLGRMPGFRLEVYEFDRLISHYMNLFGQDRVLVLPFEMMARDLRGFAERITAFMDLPAPGSVPVVVANRRRPVTMQLAQRWGNRLLSNNELSRGALVHIPRFPRRFSASEPLFQALTPKWLDKMLHENVARTIRKVASGHYAASNRRASSLIGIDLAQYGYQL